MRLAGLRAAVRLRRLVWRDDRALPEGRLRGVREREAAGQEKPDGHSDADAFRP